MRVIISWHDLDAFVSEVSAALSAAESSVEIYNIEVALRLAPSLEDTPDDRIPLKNGFEYHGRESIAKAYEVAGDWDMAAFEWRDCALERAENCVAAVASIDPGHLKAIEFCVKRSKAAWLEFSGRYELPPETI